MNEIFKPYLRKFVLVLFDDILIYSKSMGEHLQHLSMVLEILKAHKLFANESKCVFDSYEVEYLGHLISRDGVKADPQKISTMQNWPPPRNLKALRGFLGLTGYYGKFVQGYGTIAAPLTALLKKNAFMWTEKTQTTFDRMKQAMVSLPVIKLPDFTKTFVVECDASGKGLGDCVNARRRPYCLSKPRIEGKESHVIYI